MQKKAKNKAQGSQVRRTVDLNIFGEEHQLKFTINALEMLEATTDERNVSILATKPVWSLKDVVSGIHAGLKWQIPKLTREQVKDGVQILIRETSIYELQGLITAAIGLSGLVFGDAARSPFAEILPDKKQSGDDSDEDEEKSNYFCRLGRSLHLDRLCDKTHSRADCSFNAV